ncbi:MAG: transglutaminase domain-containing protein, partial [Clostridia bacterium]|nr:transglutaminase domain-containing protein [Clostridia bacterium]
GVAVAQQNYYLIAAQAIQDIYNNKTTATYKSSDYNYKVPTLVANYSLKQNGATPTTATKNFYMNYAIRQTVYVTTGNGATTGAVGASAAYPTTDSNANGFAVTDYEGQMTYEAALLMFTRILAAYATNGTLPESVALAYVPGVEVSQAPATQAPTTQAPTVEENVPAGYVSINQVATAMASAYASFEKNDRMPSTLTVGASTGLSQASYYYLAAKAVSAIYSGSTAHIAVKTNYKKPSYPEKFYTYNSATVTTANINTLATAQLTYAANNSSTYANYVTISGKGQINFYSCMVILARALSYYKTNGKLPASTSSFGSTYLAATNNCQSTNSNIVSRAKSIISNAGATTTAAKAKAIYNWVHANVSYKYYNDTYRSATTVLSDRVANCCDHAHLMNALMRASGIPARYTHADCRIGGSLYGHVYSQIFVDGAWKTIDASMKSCSYNYISWTLVTHHAWYRELPF